MHSNVNTTSSYSFKQLFKNALKKQAYTDQSEIDKACFAMNMLVEYIRYCVFDGYVCNHRHQLNKYCSMLCRFEWSKNDALQSYARACISLLLSNCYDNGSPLMSVHVALTFSQSLDPIIQQQCHDVITCATGHTVRSIHE